MFVRVGHFTRPDDAGSNSFISFEFQQNLASSEEFPRQDQTGSKATHITGGCDFLEGGVINVEAPYGCSNLHVEAL